MSSKKRILAFSSIRSDYDLMSSLYGKLREDSEIEFKILVSGAHLSESYGTSGRYIRQDRMPVLDLIETLIDSDSPSSRIKTASILLQNAIHSIERFSPDLMILAGDREDMMAGALIGSYMKIPTAHFFGGDHTSDGNVDNPVRYAISKLASVHFVIHAEHKKRLMRIGENEKRIFVVGNPAVDKFVNEKFIPKKKLLGIIGENRIKVDDNYAVLIFHPLLGFEQFAGDYFEQILQTLAQSDIKAFVSTPNTDAGNKKIIAVIKRYSNSDRFVFYHNLRRTEFINMLRHATFMIGNSSSGILESSSIPLGVINVGLRQKDRLAAENVIFIDHDVLQIEEAIKKMFSEKFMKKLKQVKNPYGDGRSVDKIHELLKKINFKDYLYKTEDPLGL